MGKNSYKCLVCNFVGNQNSKRKFYKFPTDNKRKELWLNLINRVDLIDQNFSRDWRVCQKHFTDDMLGITKKRLIRYAVPTKSSSNIPILENSLIVPPKKVSDIYEHSSAEVPVVSSINITDTNIYSHQDDFCVAKEEITASEISTTLQKDALSSDVSDVSSENIRASEISTTLQEDVLLPDVLDVSSKNIKASEISTTLQEDVLSSNVLDVSSENIRASEISTTLQEDVLSSNVLDVSSENIRASEITTPQEDVLSSNVLHNIVSSENNKDGQLKRLKKDAIPSENLPKNYTDRGFDKCCIKECETPFTEGIQSHIMPSSSSYSGKIWLEILKINNPSPNDRICSKHFKPSDYKLLKDNTVLLKFESIPTENLPENYTDRGYHLEKISDGQSEDNDDVTINNKKMPERTDGCRISKDNHAVIKKIKIPQYSLAESIIMKTGFENINADNLEFELKFDEDISEDERRFYIKLFPSVDLVREKKIHCTSCNIHLGTAPANENNIYMHPILKVSQCKKCNEFYNSGEFSKGEDGSELYCRWCGQGGEVYCCAKCPYVFCKACISINLAKSLVADIRDNENWNCFVCSPKITWPIRATHWALKNYIAKQKRFIKTYIQNETEQRHLLMKDSSSCFSQCKRDDESDTSNDSDAPLSKKSCTVVLKKRKADNSSLSIGEPKPKQQSITIVPRVDPALTLPAKQPQNVVTILPTSNVMSSTNLTQPPKPPPFILNNSITVQLNNRNLTPIGQTARPPTNFKIQNSNNIQGGQSAVKIVQLQQSGPNQHQRVQMQFAGQAAAPPPLLIRNRGVQIRPHINIIPPQNVNQNQNRTTTTTVQLGVRQASEHAPVYHNIGGFCIDLNSAAQHDSIRLPNGKLIQVKKSTTNNTNNSCVRPQIPSGVLSPVQNQPQHQFTITQSAGPLSAQIPNNPQVAFQTTPAIQQHPQPQNIQTLPAPSILPNAAGQVQIINGSIVQTLPGNAGSQTRPLLVRNIYPNTPIGKARSQLQSQIFSAMEICQHLSSKLQTLTNSNPYKNANSSGDVKELYIHLSYLFTYGIGRLKSMQESVVEDMTNMGFKTDVVNLVKGQPTTEKYSSDGDEDEIEIVEPKTTTINLDSDNEDADEIISQKTPTKLQQEAITNPKNPSNQIALKQIQSLQRKVIPAPGSRPTGSASWQRNQQLKSQLPSLQPIQPIQQQSKQLIRSEYENQINNFPQQQEMPQQLNQIGNDEDFSPFSLLAGMLEIELTEGDKAVKPTTVQKRPRKKLTTRPNPNLIKKKREENEVEKLKRNDLKLKQNCVVNVVPLRTESKYFLQVLKRFKMCEGSIPENESDNKKVEIHVEEVEKNSLINEKINNPFETKFSQDNNDHQSKQNVDNTQEKSVKSVIEIDVCHTKGTEDETNFLNSGCNEQSKESEISINYNKNIITTLNLKNLIENSQSSKKETANSVKNDEESSSKDKLSEAIQISTKDQISEKNDEDLSNISENLEKNLGENIKQGFPKESNFKSEKNQRNLNEETKDELTDFKINLTSENNLETFEGSQKKDSVGFAEEKEFYSLSERVNDQNISSKSKLNDVQIISTTKNESNSSSKMKNINNDNTSKLDYPEIIVNSNLFQSESKKKSEIEESHKTSLIQNECKSLLEVELDNENLKNSNKLDNCKEIVNIKSTVEPRVLKENESFDGKYEFNSLLDMEEDNENATNTNKLNDFEEISNLNSKNKEKSEDENGGKRVGFAGQNEPNSLFVMEQDGDRKELNFSEETKNLKSKNKEETMEEYKNENKNKNAVLGTVNNEPNSLLKMKMHNENAKNTEKLDNSKENVNIKPTIKPQVLKENENLDEKSGSNFLLDMEEDSENATNTNKSNDFEKISNLNSKNKEKSEDENGGKIVGFAGQNEHNSLLVMELDDDKKELTYSEETENLKSKNKDLQALEKYQNENKNGNAVLKAVKNESNSLLEIEPDNEDPKNTEKLDNSKENVNIKPTIKPKALKENENLDEKYGSTSLLDLEEDNENATNTNKLNDFRESSNLKSNNKEKYERENKSKAENWPVQNELKSLFVMELDDDRKELNYSEETKNLKSKNKEEAMEEYENENKNKNAVLGTVKNESNSLLKMKMDKVNAKNTEKLNNSEEIVNIKPALEPKVLKENKSLDEKRESNSSLDMGENNENTTNTNKLNNFGESSNLKSNNKEKYEEENANIKAGVPGQNVPISLFVMELDNNRKELTYSEEIKNFKSKNKNEALEEYQNEIKNAALETVKNESNSLLEIELDNEDEKNADKFDDFKEIVNIKSAVETKVLKENENSVEKCESIFLLEINNDSKEISNLNSTNKKTDFSEINENESNNKNIAEKNESKSLLDINVDQQSEKNENTSINFEISSIKDEIQNKGENIEEKNNTDKIEVIVISKEDNIIES